MHRGDVKVCHATQVEPGRKVAAERFPKMTAAAWG